jgi:hypothetical protein
MTLANVKRQVAAEFRIDQVAASVMLGRAGRELHDLAAMTDRIQNIVSVLIEGSQGGDTLYELQDLDRLRQSLSCLARFLETLSVDAPDEWRLDARSAVAELTLLDLANRLAHAEARAYDCAAGEFQAL